MSLVFNLSNKKDYESDLVSAQIDAAINLLALAKAEFAIKNPLTGEVLGDFEYQKTRVKWIDLTREHIKDMKVGEVVQIEDTKPGTISTCVSKLQRLELLGTTFKTMAISDTKILITRVE